MALPILICDDSSFARKQIARALPDDYSSELSFAANGEEALAVIAREKIDLLFLDLTMPKMDGYAVLNQLKQQQKKIAVIVVSGDIQPEAQKRVLDLGALDFIKKPVDKQHLKEVLAKIPLNLADQSPAKNKPLNINTDIWDCYKEIANVSIGRAADLLARLLDTYVVMPVPKVKLIRVEDLNSTFNIINNNSHMSAVCQGFIGAGIAGEAILIFSKTNFTDIAELMKYQAELNDTVQQELLMDIGSVMIGAFLKGIAKQLDINFSQGTPLVISKHTTMLKLSAHKNPDCEKTLAIEMRCAIEGRDIKCNLLLLFTEDSLKTLNRIVSVLAG